MVGKELETDWKLWGWGVGLSIAPVVAVNRAALRGVFRVFSLGHWLPRHWPETPEKNLPNGVLSWCTTHPCVCLDTWTCGLLLVIAWLSQKASDLALSLWMAAYAQLTLGIVLSSMAWGPGHLLLVSAPLHQTTDLLHSANSGEGPLPYRVFHELLLEFSTGLPV